MKRIISPIIIGLLLIVVIGLGVSLGINRGNADTGNNDNRPPMPPEYVGVLTAPFVASVENHVTTVQGVTTNIWSASRSDMQANIQPFEIADDVQSVKIDLYLVINGSVLFSEIKELNIQSPTDFFTFRSGLNINGTHLGVSFHLSGSVHVSQGSQLFYTFNFQMGSPDTPMDIHFELRQVYVLTGGVA